MFERNVAPPKIVSRIVIGLVVFFFAAAIIGDIALGDFVEDRPLALIALNARIRHLILVTNELDALSYYTVGFLRLVAADPLFFILGYWYGDHAINWIEKRSRTYGSMVRDGESWFRKGSYFFIFAAPNQYVCALAGATGVRLRTFFALNVSGTIARLVIVRLLAEEIEPWIDWTVGTISRYRIWVIGIAVLGALWTILGEFKGDNSEIKSLLDLEAGSSSDGESANGETGTEATGDDVSARDAGS